MLAGSYQFSMNHLPIPNGLKSPQRIASLSLPPIHHLPNPNLSQITLPPIGLDGGSSRVRPFQCNTCFRSFNRKNSLIRHQRIHSGVKPYSCNICNKKFSRKDILSRHKESLKCQKRRQSQPQIDCPLDVHNESSSSPSPSPSSSAPPTSIASLLAAPITSPPISIASLLSAPVDSSSHYSLHPNDGYRRSHSPTEEARREYNTPSKVRSITDFYF